MHDALQLRRDALDELDRARLSEHQQPGLQAAHQLLPAVEAGCVERTADVLGDGLLDAGEIENALAQHGRLHVLEFGVLAVLDGFLGPRPDQPDEAVVELVLQSDQRCRDLNESRFVGAQRAGNDLLQPVGFALDIAAQLAQTQHAQRVADLAQQIDLGGQLLRLTRPAAHEDVQDVLDLGQVLANGYCHGLHELHARRRQILALLLDALIDRQQLRQSERGAHRGNARTGGLRPPDVVKKVVQQLDGRRLGIARLALLVQAAHFAIAESEQPLDRYAAFQTVLAQRLDDRAGDPPELEDRLARCDLLELLGDGGQDVEVLRDALPADPPDEAHLVTGAHAPGPLLDRHRRLAGGDRHGLSLFVGLQIQQQQRAFGQQRAAAHRAQIVEEREQHQRKIAAAGQHALQIAGQLHHRPHQRIEALSLVLALGHRGQQVGRHLLHFLGEQGGAVDLENPQDSLHTVQLLRAALEKRGVALALDVILESRACVRERDIQLAADEIQRLGGDFRHASTLSGLSLQVPPTAEDICRRAAVLPSSSRLKAPEVPIGSFAVPGSLKPAAALRSPADSSASLAMAAEVAWVDSAVWALISFRTCMLRAMFCAAPVCWRELPEMFWTRLAI